MTATVLGGLSGALACGICKAAIIVVYLWSSKELRCVVDDLAGKGT